MIYYFAYGSNLDVGQMQSRCPGCIPRETGFVDNYALRFTRNSTGWNGGVADIVSVPKARVWGLVYSLTNDDLSSLDTYEGHPTAYERFRLTVRTPTQILEGVWTYAVKQKLPHVSPAQEYVALIIQAARQLNFPREYVDEILKTASRS